jgi:cell division protein FtsI/penicillin-binding protein 2
MSDVVNAKRAAGRRARVNGVHVAAKTGTAEYGPMRNRRKHAWMIAFAPYETPEIALAAIIEDGESGGATAAPVVASVLAHHFETTPVGEDEDEEASRAELRDPDEDAGVQDLEEHLAEEDEP